MQGMEMTILAKLDLGDWQEQFSDRIYERGLAYYEDEAVHDIERTKNKITAAVDGSDTYTVTLYVKDDAVYNMTCTCPYAAKGENCKHMAAVLLALEDGQLLQEEPETNGRKRTWKDILQSMTEQEVRSLLFQLLEHDPEKQQSLVLTYSKGMLSQKEMQKLLRQAKNLCRPYEREGFVDYHQESELYDEIYSYLSRVIPPLVKRHCSREAFTLVSQVFADLVELEFEESGENLMELCRDSWKDSIQAASSDEQQKMYAWFEEQMNSCRQQMKLDADYAYWYEYIISIYESILLEDFPSSRLFQLRNLAWVDDVLDQYAQEHKRTSPVYESTEYGIYLVRRIQLMQVLSYPSEEIEKYTASHYNNKEVRDMLIHEFFAKGEYEKAIPVLRDSMDKNGYSRYWENLLTAYKAMGDTENYKRELWNQINEIYQYNLDKIRKFKECCDDEEWKQRIGQILQLNTCSDILPAVLAEEKMYDKLWDYVSQQNNIAVLNRYETILRPQYGEKIRDIYVRYVTGLMPDSRHRSQYRNCIQYLKKICQYPGGEAIVCNLARDWKQTYTTRRAMKEELELAGF